MHTLICDLVAQLDSALDFESNGCGFESRQGCFMLQLIVCIYIWVRSSVVEHGIADPMVAGSIPVAPFLMIYYAFVIILVSLDGQDTRFSPWRPGFDSRTRNE